MRAVSIESERIGVQNRDLSECDPGLTLYEDQNARDLITCIFGRFWRFFRCLSGQNAPITIKISMDELLIYTDHQKNMFEKLFFLLEEKLF